MGIRLGRRRFLQIGTSICTMLSGGCIAAPSQNSNIYTDRSWSLFRGDAKRSGCFSVSVPNSSPAIKWTYSTDASIWSSPIVSDGIVYIGSDDNCLHAIDEKTGKQRWCYETASEIFSTPAIHDGTVYFGSTDKNIYAVDAKTGTKEWIFETDGIVISSPVVVDSTVYIGGNCRKLECEWNYDIPKEGHGVVHAIDAKSGEREWQYQTEVGVASSPAIHEGMVYIGSSDGAVFAINSTNGIREWRYDAGAVIQSTPAITDQMAFVGDWDGHIHGIDIENGTRIWINKTDGSYISGSAAVCRDTVYIGVVGVPTESTSEETTGESQRYRGTLFALDSSTGAERWSFKTEAPEIGSSPAVSESLVIVGSHDQQKKYPGGLHAIDLDTGRQQWKFEVSGVGIGSSPAIVEGTVYIGSTTGAVHALTAD